MVCRNRFGVLIGTGLLTMSLISCGGSSGSGDDSTGAGSDDGGMSGNTTDDQNGGTTASFNLTTQYNNGFVADTGQQTNVAVGFSPPRQSYTIDTAANIVTDGLPFNNVPDIYYDDQGRATETRDGPSSVPYVVTYNDNGTVASISRTTTSSSTGRVTTDVTDFIYDGDQLTGRSTTRTRDGESSNYGDVSYTYNANGALAAATVNRASLGFLVTEEYTFQTDTQGRVTEVVELDTDGTVDMRHVLTYDANNNVTRHDMFASTGELFISREYTYTASPEPAANLIGALMSLNVVFLPEDDLLIL